MWVECVKIRRELKKWYVLVVFSACRDFWLEDVQTKGVFQLVFFLARATKKRQDKRKFHRARIRFRKLFSFVAVFAGGICMRKNVNKLKI